MLVKEIQYKRNIPILTTVSILFDHIYPSHKELYCRVRFMVFNASLIIFQLYLGGQFYWLRKPEYPEETTDLSLVTDKLDLILLY